MDSQRAEDVAGQIGQCLGVHDSVRLVADLDGHRDWPAPDRRPRAAELSPWSLVPWSLMRWSLMRCSCREYASTMCETSRCRTTSLLPSRQKVTSSSPEGISSTIRNPPVDPPGRST